MIFQGPQATIRWVGNEDGLAPYPAWNALPEKTARSGISTAADGDPSGAAWLPNECDARMRDSWFWNTKNAGTVKSVDELMTIYCGSVGRGANLLLNNTPDTSGLIPEADARRAAEFGAEVRKRFGRSAAETNGQGNVQEVKLTETTAIDRAIIMEDIAQGERVRSYVLEGLSSGHWTELCRGSAVGHKKIDRFQAVRVTAVRWRCLKSSAIPLIRRFAVFKAETH
jgi:alpha-L-fucosidase